jgi:hypothetical protein
MTYGTARVSEVEAGSQEAGNDFAGGTRFPVRENGNEFPD